MRGCALACVYVRLCARMTRIRLRLRLRAYVFVGACYGMFVFVDIVHLFIFLLLGLVGGFSGWVDRIFIISVPVLSIPQFWIHRHSYYDAYPLVIAVVVFVYEWASVCVCTCQRFCAHMIFVLRSSRKHVRSNLVIFRPPPPWSSLFVFHLPPLFIRTHKRFYTNFFTYQKLVLTINWEE